ncbi:MAG: hypothetical protein JSS99_07330 [Actinobacteria bacterium]|nr:hypothetical protein [Actinomycetota bacterium]
MRKRPGRRLLRHSVRSLVLACVLMLIPAAPAFAGPQWLLNVDANSSAAPGGTLNYHVQASNIGDAQADGSGGDPIVVRASLPAQVTATGVVKLDFGQFGTFDASFFGWTCTGDGPDPTATVVGAHNVECSLSGTVVPNEYRSGFFPVKPIIVADIAGDASGTLESQFTVSGAGASPVATYESTRITRDPPVFGVDVFDGAVAADAAGSPETQAGGHPYSASTTIVFNSETNPTPLLGDVWPVAAPKTLAVNLPPGFVGYPAAAARCDAAELADKNCPETSQVGTVVIHLNGNFATNVLGPIPLYNLNTPPDVPAEFGFNVYQVVSTLQAHVRSDSDYGVTVTAPKLPEGLAFTSTTVTLWGFPSDPAHTPERACQGASDYPQYVPAPAGPTCASGAPRVPFLRNPTSCTQAGRGLTTTLSVDSWKDPGRTVTASFTSHDLPGYPRAQEHWGPELGTTGCDREPFTPTLRATPVEPARAGSPTGFAFDLSIPQPQDPDIISQSDLRKAVVTLPVGMRVSPASAAGLAGCSSAQIKLHTLEEPTCPDGSKIGDVTLETPLLDTPLKGNVYLATPFDNPSDSLIALYIVVRGQGVLIKLPGQVDVNQSNGQITTTFDNNPQAPFSDLQLTFNDGPRAPITTPDRCGTYTVHADMIGWSGASASSDASFTLAHDADGTPCKNHGFSPGFSAGTENPVAGKTSPLHVRVTRPDQDQLLAGIQVHTPQGLTGYVSRVRLCGAVEALEGICTFGSQIGDVTVGAGSGSNPFYITNGRAFLTGPYKGAPFGLSIVVPAIAGPFNLGNVNVRSALFVGRHDATLRVVSDSLPTILRGILLDVRDVRVDVNKPGFIINPTSCAVKRIDGTIVSTLAASASVSSRFQVGECANLGFKPRMVLTVGGRGHVAAGRTTPLSTTLTMPARGQANLRSVRVTLPGTINARLNTINDACTRAEFEHDISKCAHAKAGTATAVTPLLNDPLRGNVYFVKNGHGIPDLFVALRGQVSFDLIGRITIVDSTFLRTTFATAPDVPIRSFTLRLLGGPTTASIGAFRNLCSPASRRARADLLYTAQNGKVLHVTPHLRVKGCTRRR